MDRRQNFSQKNDLFEQFWHFLFLENTKVSRGVAMRHVFLLASGGDFNRLSSMQTVNRRSIKWTRYWDNAWYTLLFLKSLKTVHILTRFALFTASPTRLRYSGWAIPLRPRGGGFRISGLWDSGILRLFLGHNAIFRQKKPKNFRPKNGPKVAKNCQNCPQIGEINREGPPENPNESPKYRN